MRRLALPDGHLAYRDEGAGRPLVLLHGGALDHRMWDAQVDDLAADHRVVVPDARGHGRSSTPRAPFRHGDDLAALIGHLDAGPVTLVGLSMGGGTAVDLALEHPHLVRALVVSGAGTSEPEFTDPWALEVLATWRRTQEAGDIAGWVETFLLFAAGPHRGLEEVDADVVARCRAMATDTLATHVADGPPVLPTPVGRTWERLPGITVPVLALCGALDAPDHLAMADRLVRAVPDGRSARVDGTAHYPNMERPEEFGAALREFLDATVSPGART